tara:strand:+ start:752 stop:1498 length:747 start_codon:yes stop_codon:yes gene_type:complete
MKSFSHYKTSLDNILENSFKKDKELFKKNLSVIMGAIKFSKPLREFFTLYNEIESKEFSSKDESKSYLTEALNFLRDNKNKLKKVTPILDKIIEDRKELCKETKNTIYGKIDNIVFNTNVKNIENITKDKNYLCESMSNRSTKKITRITNPKILSKVLSKNYKEAYDGSLTESQKNILKNTLLMTEDTLNNEFKNIKDIALNKLDTLISESKEDGLSVKLVEVKNEILTLNPTKKSYIKVRGLVEDLK